MAIKKRAVCMQTVAMGGKVFRCSSCGHMAVFSEKEDNSKCPLCEASMVSVENDKSEKEPIADTDV